MESPLVDLRWREEDGRGRGILKKLKYNVVCKFMLKHYSLYALYKDYIGEKED